MASARDVEASMRMSGVERQSMSQCNKSKAVHAASLTGRREMMSRRILSGHTNSVLDDALTGWDMKSAKRKAT
jgi:hypothetical protein